MSSLRANAVADTDENEITNNEKDEIQSISTFRRALPQVNYTIKYRLKSVSTVLVLHLNFHPTVFRGDGKKSHDSEPGRIWWIFFDCDPIIDWIQRFIESK